MAKKVTFNKVEITVGERDGKFYFNRMDVSKALGYKSGINTSPTAHPFKLGSQYFDTMHSMDETFKSATGKRREAVAGFIALVETEFDIKNEGKGLDNLDDLAMDWAIARVEANTAQQILEEATARELELFTKLQQERT